MRTIVSFFLTIALPGTAAASVAPECQGLPKPDDYNEIVQYDFLLNYYSLNSSFSPLHAPVPHEPGHGSFGVDLSFMPPLGCDKRFVLDWTKTEKTNVSPIIPRIVASYAFPALFAKEGEWTGLVPYVGAAYVPPVTFAGTQNVIMSVELGVGTALGIFETGARFHATVQRTVGDLAGAFDEENDPLVDDLFLGSTFGADLMGGVTAVQTDSFLLKPYAALGFMDVSTFFWVGDLSLIHI